MNQIDIAKKYLNYQELPGNKGFKDPEFQKKMTAVGHKSGESWCAYFTELVFKEAFPNKFKELDKLFSAGAVKTFDNFKAAGYRTSLVPVEGALVIWRHYTNGVAGWQGHAGVVVKTNGTTGFESIEGNTNDDGSREGYEVAYKKRTMVKKATGLNVYGFVIIE